MQMLYHYPRKTRLIQEQVSEINTWLFAKLVFTQPVESIQLGGFQGSVDN